MNEPAFFWTICYKHRDASPRVCSKKQVQGNFSATVAILNKICYNIVQILF